MPRCLLLVVSMVFSVLLVGCEALGAGEPIRSLEGEYVVDATLTITPGNVKYEGSVSLGQVGDSLSGNGQVTARLGPDQVGSWEVNDVSGTYDHPNLTMIWTVEDLNEPDPNEARSIWAIDATVGPRADSIDGLIEVADQGNGSITLTKN